MKRLPIVLSLLALIVLAASLAYWVLQLYQPPQRPLAAAPAVAAADPSIDAAQTLFGGQAAATVATNYLLSGVVAAGRDSVAIIAASGSPPQALRIGKEIAPGVTVTEVHARYVMLSDGGVMKRIELPADTKPAAAGAAPGPVAGAPAGEPQSAPGAVRTSEPPEAGRGDSRPPPDEEPPPATAPAAPAVAVPAPPAPAPVPVPAPAPAPAPAPVPPPIQAVPAPAQQGQASPARSPASPVYQPPVAR